MPRPSYPSYGAPNAAGYGAAPNPAPYGAAPNAPGGGAHPPPIGFNPSVVHGVSSCKLLFHTRGYYTVVQRYELYFEVVLHATESRDKHQPDEQTGLYADFTMLLNH